MAVDFTSQEGRIIRQLIPLSTLSLDQFKLLCHVVTIKNAEPGTLLFERNDTTNALYYLISGDVSLRSDNLIIETIKSGSNSALFALAHQIPRKIDAYTNTPVRFMRISSDIFKALAEFSDNTEAMTALLKTPVLKNLPATCLQKIIVNIEQVAFHKGEKILKQGDQGDFFYFIKKGQCIVYRCSSPKSKAIKLADLDRYDTFGEDSLLSGEPSHLTIKALTKITIYRLRKEKFISFVKRPSLKYISHSQLKKELENKALLLDVRSPDKYKRHHLSDSTNIPFFLLPLQLKQLNKKKNIIVICSNGKKSEAVAFLLKSHGFTAMIVNGGMKNIPLQKVNALPVVSGSIDNSIETAMDEQTFSQLESQQLIQIIKNLKVERMELKNKYRILSRQMDELKVILDNKEN